MKVCTKCVKTKTLDAFTGDKTRSDGLFPQCRDCQRAYRQENRERLLATRRDSYTASVTTERERCRTYRQAHLDELRQRDREYYAANRDRISERKRARHPEIAAHMLEYNRDWRRKNPQRHVLRVIARRAGLRGADASLTPEEWAEIKRRYGNHCLACGQQEPSVKLTIDHVLPLKMGGKHVAANVQPLCRSCNSRKNARHIDYRVPLAVADLDAPDRREPSRQCALGLCMV